MNKKLITMLVTFCFMLLLAPVSVMAATPTNAPIVIDVEEQMLKTKTIKLQIQALIFVKEMLIMN